MSQDIPCEGEIYSTHDFMGRKGICIRVDHSSTMPSTVSYNKATERKHTNDENDSIRSFPTSMI